MTQFVYDGKPLSKNYKAIDISWIKPTPNCKLCRPTDNYVCFDCEMEQVQSKTNAIYTDCCTWVERCTES